MTLKTKKPKCAMTEVEIRLSQGVTAFYFLPSFSSFKVMLKHLPLMR